MTQKEFEERTGLKLSACEFESVHSIYMACGDGMDKDAFCKEWKRHGESKLLAAIWRELKKQQQVVEGKTTLIALMEDDQKKTVDFLLERAQKFSDSELLKYCVERMGYGYVIRRKLEMELPLWEADKEWLKNTLKGIE